MWLFRPGRFALALSACLLILLGCATAPSKIPVEAPSVPAVQSNITERPLDRISVTDKCQHATVGWIGLKLTLDLINLSKEDLQSAIQETLRRANLFGKGPGPGMALDVEVL